MKLREIDSLPDDTIGRDWDNFNPPWIKRAYDSPGKVGDVELRIYRDTGIIRIAGFVDDQIMSYLALFETKHGHQVQALQVAENHRGKGLANIFYLVALRMLNLTVISDHQQTGGGKAMWKKLMADPLIKVDSIDMSTGKPADLERAYGETRFVLRAKASE